MCQNKLYFRKTQMESKYHNLSLVPAPPCHRNNAAIQGMQKLTVSAFGLPAGKLLCYGISLILSYNSFH